LTDHCVTEMFIFGSVYFAASGKSSAGTILLFKLYPALSTYNPEFVTLAVRWIWL